MNNICFYLNDYRKSVSMTFTQVFILSLIEGLTEFLPISSTGHLITASAMMGISEDQFIKSFNIIIQFGAILSVLVLYWRRFLPNLEFYKKLFIAFLPAAVIGLAVKSKIDLILGSVQIVAWALVLGGVVLILTDRYFKDHPGNLNIERMSWKDCLKLGFLQCFAFIPGVSRSGATIVGGLALGMSRKEAAEFSFFLAVPTLAGATLIKTLGLIKTIDSSQISWLLLGMALSFVFALIAIRFFIQVVSRFGFKHFGYYRIALGLVILFLIHRGML
jgi:undecaprenyl-diphosphatase